MVLNCIDFQINFSDFSGCWKHNGRGANSNNFPIPVSGLQNFIFNRNNKICFSFIHKSASIATVFILINKVLFELRYMHLILLVNKRERFDFLLKLHSFGCDSFESKKRGGKGRKSVEKDQISKDLVNWHESRITFSCVESPEIWDYYLRRNSKRRRPHRNHISHTRWFPWPRFHDRSQLSFR